MSKHSKLPKVLGITSMSNDGEMDLHLITITAHKFQQLPMWLQASVRAAYVNNRHVQVYMNAKDELHALTLFKRYWSAMQALAIYEEGEG